MLHYWTTLNFTDLSMADLDELIPKERPEKGLTSGLSSFSLIETGAEKLRVVGHWSKSGMCSSS